jgi:hypothetical protein
MADDIHTALGDIREDLGRIDGKLDMLLGEKLTERVRSLEKSRSWLAGVSAAVGGITAAVVTGVGIIASHWSFKF